MYDTQFGVVMIEARALRKSFGAVPVLDEVDVDVQPGTMLALLGPNGAGKSTIVRILATLLDMDGGTARVAGHDVTTQAQGVRASIGLTGQQTAVDGLLTGYENLVMMGRLFRLDASAARRRAGELLAQFDLVEATDRQVKTYSGGMRRKLDVAISLITAPAVLFLDEPTTGLDPRSRSDVWQTIRGLLSGGTTILLTTQYLEEADQLADRVAVLDGGRIVAEGAPSELKRRAGAERLELTFPCTAALDRGARVLGDVAAKVNAHTLAVPVSGPADVKRLLDRTGDNGIEISKIWLTEPSLDDVFLALTGHRPAGAQNLEGVR